MTLNFYLKFYTFFYYNLFLQYTIFAYFFHMTFLLKIQNFILILHMTFIIIIRGPTEPVCTENWLY